jgi:hypothetical protein
MPGLIPRPAFPVMAPSSWYEVKPFFARVDEEYVDMHAVVKKIREFSFFIVKGADLTKIFLQTSDVEAKVVQGTLKNALLEATTPKAFSAGRVAYLKMRRHYAVPIARELAPSLIYATIEKIGKPCFIAVTAKHSDESYQISQFVENSTYNKSLAKDLFSAFNPFDNSTADGQPKRRISPKKLMVAELAKEKQQLRHFHCTLAIGAQDLDTIESIVKVLSDDGLVIGSIERDSMYRNEVKKPLLFAAHFCVLSDIELANIIALPENPRIYRLGISRAETRTSGPSQLPAPEREAASTSSPAPETTKTPITAENDQTIIRDYGKQAIPYSTVLDEIECPACHCLNATAIQFTEDRDVVLPDRTTLAVVAGRIYTQCTDCLRVEPFEPAQKRP